MEHCKLEIPTEIRVSKPALSPLSKLKRVFVRAGTSKQYPAFAVLIGISIAKTSKMQIESTLITDVLMNLLEIDNFCFIAHFN